MRRVGCRFVSHARQGPSSFYLHGNCRLGSGETLNVSEHALKLFWVFVDGEVGAGVVFGRLLLFVVCKFLTQNLARVVGCLRLLIQHLLGLSDVELKQFVTEILVFFDCLLLAEDLRELGLHQVFVRRVVRVREL